VYARARLVEEGTQPRHTLTSGVLYEAGYEIDRMRPCSVAVALGSQDLGVADVTAELYHQGMAPVVVFAGATSPRTGRACRAGRRLTLLRDRPCDGRVDINSP